MKFETRAIHAGQKADKTTGATIVPIYQTSTYTFEAFGKHRGYEYTRAGNPTRAALEEALASLEGGKYGFCFSSGLAAITTILSTLKAGDEVLAGDDLYGGTVRLFDQVFKNFNIIVKYIDGRESKNFKEAISNKTKLIWLETPTNPMLRLIDINEVCKIAKSKNITVAVDNTFSSPFFQNPLELGADIVMHSTTKYIGGHSDVVGGVVITSNEEIKEKIGFYQNAIGGTPSPFDCFLQLRGIKTLAIRMKKHEENAMKIAEFLENHSMIKSVNYPGLKSHPQHALAKSQMKGFSGMVSFDIKGDLEVTKKIVESTKIFSLAESLGGVESLIGHPATMTHAAIPQEKRESLGITDTLIRISVGIEDTEDLINDLDNALKAASKSENIALS